MRDPLLPKRFLFSFAVPCLYRDSLWTAKGAGLENKYRLVDFEELDGGTARADVRMAWSEAGLVFSVSLGGKKQPPWCRTTRPEDSDGVQLWIDTRDVHNVHRAGRFCHRFLFMPVGGGSRADKPVAQWLPINRAREQPGAIPEGALKTRCKKRADGYLLEGLIAAEALTGFDPQEHPRLGFTYAVIDRELGEQTLGVGAPMPYRTDPSLWGTLQLTR